MCSAIWAAPFWLLFGPTLAVAQEGPDRFRTMLDSVVPGLLAEHEVPGLIIAYLHDGVPALTTGYGFVDPSRSEEVSGQRFDDFMRATVFEPNLMTA